MTQRLSSPLQSKRKIFIGCQVWTDSREMAYLWNGDCHWELPRVWRGRNLEWQAGSSDKGLPYRGICLFPRSTWVWLGVFKQRKIIHRTVIGTFLGHPGGHWVGKAKSRTIRKLCCFMWFQTLHFKWLKLVSNISSQIKMETIISSFFWPTRSKFVYSCSTKICDSGFNKLLESIFCINLVGKVFSLQNVV